MTIGIYALHFKGSDKVYIGQSLRIEERFARHKLRITTGLANYKLMQAYSSYGLPSLEIILETNADEDLDILENEAIQIYDAVNNGFNINSKAGGGGVGLQGDLHGNSKFTNAAILKVFNLLTENISFKQIVDETGVSIHTIRDVSKGRTHRWLKTEFPIEYDKMLLLKGHREKNTAKDRGIIYTPILDPEGTLHTVDNLNAFAMKYNLNSSHLSGVLHGIRKTHKGWKLPTI